MTGNRQEPGWREPDKADLDRLTQVATFAADLVWFEERTNREITEAERTRRMVRASLRLLLANGLIAATNVPDDQFVFMDPPDDGKVDRDTET